MAAATGPAGLRRSREGRRDAQLVQRLQTMQAIVQDSYGAAGLRRAGYGCAGGITMSLRIIMSSRVGRFAGLRPGWVTRAAK